MNSYEARQEAKRDRYLDRAEKAKARSTAAYEQSSKATEHIPFGQPILVGHHSERTHRNAIARAHRSMDKCVEESNKAEYYANKADSVGKGGISSDDPDAITKLKTKLAGMEEHRELIKASNKIVRVKPKNEKTEGKIEKLEKLGYSNSEAVGLFEPDFCGRIGIASYVLQNLGGNIKRVKDRIASLESRQDKESFDIDFEGGKISVNYEENRVQVYHDEKPSVEIRQSFKSSGFRWSRYNTCWQRHLNALSLNLAKNVCGLN